MNIVFRAGARRPIAFSSAVIALSLVFHVHAAAEPRMTVFGTLGGQSSEASAINTHGEVVGVSQRADGSYHAFVWTERAGMNELGIPTDSSLAYDINERGEILGERVTATGDRRAFLWTRGHVLDLGTLQGATGHSTAEATNASGHVTGTSSVQGKHGEQYHAFLWTPQGGMQDLGTLGGGESLARDINDRGHVVGESLNAAGERHAFLWTPRTGMRALGLGGVESAALGINNRGQLVGYRVHDDGEVRAVLRTVTGRVIELGTLGGDFSVATAINEHGQVVGDSTDASGERHAFLWTAQTGMIRLGKPGQSSGAADINEQGQVVGTIMDASGQRRAALWTVSTRLADTSAATRSRSRRNWISESSWCIDIASELPPEVTWLND